MPASQSGLPRNADFNGGTTYGVGSYQLSIENGWRASSAVAFLRPVRTRRNLTVAAARARDARAVRGHARDRRRMAVRAARCTRARAAREVILSAGAIQTPQLLQLSGVGPADLLAALQHTGRRRIRRGGREPAGPLPGAHDRAPAASACR